MSESIERVEDSTSRMDVTDVISQVEYIQHVMESVMQIGEHYGVIPGCGTKPSLLKAGAEKLGMTFRLAPTFHVVERERERGHREYYFECKLTHIPTGQYIGMGVGMASSLESKWRYISGDPEWTGELVPQQYWDLRKEDARAAQQLLGGKGFTAAKNPDTSLWEIAKAGEKIERDNPADVLNTVLKIGKKRSHIDAILTATAASDIFTQDIEELEIAHVKHSPSTKPGDKPSATPDLDAAKAMILTGDYSDKYRGKTVRDIVITDPEFARRYIEGGEDFALVAAFELVLAAWEAYQAKSG